MSRVLVVAMLVLIGSLLVPTVGWASSISASPSPISDTIYQNDINQNNTDLPWFLLDTTNATTTVDVTITQTGSWSVDATVSVTGVPTGADTPPNIALEMSPDGGTNWYTSGSTIRNGNCPSPPCSDNFTVWYRLNLDDLGDGASSTYGNYSFNVTFQLTDAAGPNGSDGVSITISADEVASIMIYSGPTVYDASVDQSDLTARYFGGSDGFARFTVRVYAISDYEVTAHASITGCSGGCQPDGLLQANVYGISTDDEGCIINQPGWQSLPITTESSAIFTGCNTMGGATYSTVRLALRMDLANLGDSSTTWSLNFQITVTITEQ
jgi:hypothetical protein